MNERRSSVFLERQSYRRRRLVDSIRFLPVLGTLLWAVPLLWPTGEQNGVTTSAAIIYIFAVWFAMSVLAAILSHAVTKRGVDDGGNT